MIEIIENARRLRALIEKAAASLDDADASTAVELYPHLTYSGELIKAGTRINWEGTVKRAAVDLWDTRDNSPEKAPTLWEDIGYRDGYRVIPNTITSTLAFAKGEVGWWGDVLLKSTIDGNVWNPDEYAAGWEVI